MSDACQFKKKRSFICLTLVLFLEVLGVEVKIEEERRAKKEKKKSRKSLGELQGDGDFSIEPSEKPPQVLDCSQWPLLLKVCGGFGFAGARLATL